MVTNVPIKIKNVWDRQQTIHRSILYPIYRNQIQIGWDLNGNYDNRDDCPVMGSTQI